MPTIPKLNPGPLAVFVACALLFPSIGQPEPIPADQTPLQAQISPPAKADSIQASPLAETKDGSGLLFTRLESSDTGIVFSNQLSLENQRNFTFNGAGVASGDFDGDGLNDLYLVTEEGQSRLYKNLGGLKFEDVTEAAGIAQDPSGFAIGAVFADIDNDADLDLFLANWKSPDQLYRNNGDGTFTDIAASAGVAYTGGSTTTTFADYDRDGDLDFFVATYRPFDFSMDVGTPEIIMQDGQIVLPEDQRGALELVETEKGLSVRQLGEPDLLYRNNGDGTFSEVSKAAGIVGGYWGLSASFSDIDNDGWPDLYVTNDFWSPDTFYINNGDGTFSLIDPDQIQHTPTFSMGMDFADINNDGYTDYFVGDMLSRDPTLRLTQHGLMDTTHPPDEAAAQVMRNALYVNNRDGSFTDIAWFAGLAASDWTWSTKFGDLDLDGFTDLIVTNGMIGDLMDSDILADNNLPQFQNAPAYLPDYPRLATPNYAFRNNGDLTFTEVGSAWGMDTQAISHGATLADLDNDGDLDLVVNNMNEPVGIYRNNATHNRILIDLVGLRSNTHGIGARVSVTTQTGQTQTRIMSSSGGYLSGHSPQLVFGLGTSELISSIKVAWPSGHIQTFLHLDDDPLPLNHRYTITEPDTEIMPPPAQRLAPGDTQFEEVGMAAGINQEHIEAEFDDNQYEGYDDFEEQPLLPRRLSALGPGVSWTDIDGDGDDDLYVAGAHGQNGTIYRNQGQGTFQAFPNRLVPADVEELATLWLEDASFISSFSRYEVPSAPTAAITSAQGSVPVTGPGSGGALAISDIDGDGDLDLFVGGRALPNQWPLPAPSRLLLNHGIGYSDVTSDLAPDFSDLGMVTGAIWLDVDSDGDSDLLIATEYGPVRLFRNDSGRLVDATAAAGLDQWHGLWTGITAADFNHDGHMDFAVANWGLNTRYRASDEYPAMLYAGKIDGEDDVDIVEAEYIDGVLRPMRERGKVGAGMPFVYEKFDTFRAYAEATLDEIFGSRLEDTLTLKANTLAHSVFINDGQGGFHAAPLPRQAQLTTGYGITSADFDNDGHDDLYLAGNFSHMNDEFRQFTGGVSYWLKGNGDGTFTAVPAADSGLFVPYDARGVAVSDYDQNGWVDVAVGINDGRPMLFRNRGIPNSCALSLRLVSRAETNRRGIGSRIMVTRSDGLVITRENHAGSGYFSQDSAVQLFGLGQTSEARVQVRWPDGALSETSIQGCGPVTIQQSAQEN